MCNWIVLWMGLSINCTMGDLCVQFDGDKKLWLCLHFNKDGGHQDDITSSIWLEAGNEKWNWEVESVNKISSWPKTMIIQKNLGDFGQGNVDSDDTSWYKVYSLLPTSMSFNIHEPLGIILLPVFVNHGPWVQWSWSFDNGPMISSHKEHEWGTYSPSV